MKTDESLPWSDPASDPVGDVARIGDAFAKFRLVVDSTTTLLDELDRVWKAANKRDAETDAAVKRIQQRENPPSN